MHWFGGSIAEAVTLSKQKNAIFVVFVEGENDLSVEMAATIDDTAVETRLSDQANFLAVKLKSGSPNYTHFAQIYQFVPVPSLFFIGRNGTPLEVVCAGVQASNLATRIDRILAEHHKENKPIQPSTSGENVREETVNFLRTEGTVFTPKPAENKENTEKTTAEKKHADSVPEPSAPPAKVAKTDESPDYEVVCKDDVCVRQPKTKVDEAGPSQSKITPPVEQTQKEPIDTENGGSVEDKIERAKELIEVRRREKADKEKEAEKQKEMDRRAQGQGVAELKRWQADQELKQIQEERKREKMENNLARQRILDQIAQDRAERRARDAPAPAPSAPPQRDVEPPISTPGDSSCRTRIQFKLPDGSSHTAHFDADGPLADVQTYVADNLQLSRSTFSLWTAFPRCELTQPGASLRALQLAPSAALLVLPRRAGPVAAPPASYFSVYTFLTQLFTTIILQPTQQIYEWLRSRLFPPTTPATPREPSPSVPQPPQPNLGNVRRRGNIHRLPSDRPEDDNNTWNGNSTQQMYRGRFLSFDATITSHSAEPQQYNQRQNGF